MKKIMLLTSIAFVGLTTQAHSQQYYKPGSMYLGLGAGFSTPNAFLFHPGFEVVMGAWQPSVGVALGLKLDGGLGVFPSAPFIFGTFSITVPVHIVFHPNADWYFSIGAGSFFIDLGWALGFAWNTGFNWNFNRYFMLGFEFGGQHHSTLYLTVSARFKFGPSGSPAVYEQDRANREKRRKARNK